MIIFKVDRTEATPQKFFASCETFFKLWLHWEHDNLLFCVCVWLKTLISAALSSLQVISFTARVGRESQQGDSGFLSLVAHRDKKIKNKNEKQKPRCQNGDGGVSELIILGCARR